MIEFNVVLAAVVPVFLITGAGFVLRRLGWLTEEADHSLLRLTINLLLPCLLLDSALGNPALSEWRNLLLAPQSGAGRWVGTRSCVVLHGFARWTKRVAAKFTVLRLYNTGSFNPAPASLRSHTVGCCYSNLGVELALTAGVLVLERTRARGDGAVDQRAVGWRWCGVGVDFLWRRDSHPRGCPQDD